MRIFGTATMALCLSACGQQQAADPAPSASQDALSTPVENRQDPPSPRPQPQPQAPDSPAAQQSADPAPPPPPRPKSRSYRAIGTEPFWAVTVKGSTATLERPDKAPQRFSVAQEDDGRALRYFANGFTMTVTEGPCSDGMSDAIWSDRVSVAFGEGTLKGCGGDRDDPAAQDF